MELIRGIHNIRPQHFGCVLTIGNFDGVHLGHAAVLKGLLADPKENNLPSTVMLFEPQPQEFFAKSNAPARLTRLRDKLRLLSNLGIERVICISFNQAFANMHAEQFVSDILIKKLGVKALTVGDDFRFGGDREGDFALLEQAGIKSGFSVENTPTHLDAGSDVRISSTEVRQALVDGEFSRAERLLGRPYSITGRVQYGQQLGRTIGFPTANIALRRIKAPLRGVFAVGVRRENGLRQKGVANIGTKPTVGQFQPNLEVHVFEQSGELYGERLTIEFIEKIREEKRFDGVDLLQRQIVQDSKIARKILAH